MCGIAGAFGRQSLSPEVVDTTLKSMELRGPDASNALHLVTNGQSLHFLQSRLAIVDLDERSNQPFVKDGLILIYNGEIYNYLEVKKDLESAGHTFSTNSDTEVLLEAYRCWGENCTDYLEGMWAFVVFDQREGELFFSRDRFGEKPLFWCWYNETLFFASETRFIWKMLGERFSVNSQKIKKYLAFGYKALFDGQGTFYDGIFELPAGCSARLNAPRALEHKKYWQLAYSPQKITLQDAVAESARLVKRAIGLRLRSDVPLAYCLSGGVDSTAIAGIASTIFGQEVNAYSIYSDDVRYDESKNADLMVKHLGCRHVIAKPGNVDFIDRMKHIISYHDAPVSTISFYIQSVLAELIAGDGCKVALTGNGADELFTGYYDHYNFWLSSMRNRPDFSSLLEEWREGYGQFVRNPVLSDPLCFVKNPSRRDHVFLNSNQFSGMLKSELEFPQDKKYSADILRNRMLNEVYHETLPVLLRENDLVFMRSSIENRTPFLDRELAEFLAKVPSEHLIHNGYPKYLLRKAVAEIVPREIVFDRQKRGFNASIDDMFPVQNPENQDWLLADSPIFDYVNRCGFESYLKHAEKKNSDSKFMFSFISAKLFLESQS